MCVTRTLGDDEPRFSLIVRNKLAAREKKGVVGENSSLEVAYTRAEEFHASRPPTQLAA